MEDDIVVSLSPGGEWKVVPGGDIIPGFGWSMTHYSGNPRTPRRVNSF